MLFDPRSIRTTEIYPKVLDSEGKRIHLGDKVIFSDSYKKLSRGTVDGFLFHGYDRRWRVSVNGHTIGRGSGNYETSSVIVFERASEAEHVAAIDAAIIDQQEGAVMNAFKWMREYERNARTMGIIPKEFA